MFSMEKGFHGGGGRGLVGLPPAGPLSLNWKEIVQKTLEPSSSQFSIQSSRRRRQVFVKVCPRLGHGIVAGFLFISKVANQMTCDKCGPQGYLCERYSEWHLTNNGLSWRGHFREIYINKLIIGQQSLNIKVNKSRELLKKSCFKTDFYGTSMPVKWNINENAYSCTWFNKQIRYRSGTGVKKTCGNFI